MDFSLPAKSPDQIFCPARAPIILVPLNWSIAEWKLNFPLQEFTAWVVRYRTRLQLLGSAGLVCPVWAGTRPGLDKDSFTGLAWPSPPDGKTSKPDESIQCIHLYFALLYTTNSRTKILLMHSGLKGNYPALTKATCGLHLQFRNWEMYCVSVMQTQTNVRKHQGRSKLTSKASICCFWVMTYMSGRELWICMSSEYSIFELQLPRAS